MARRKYTHQDYDKVNKVKGVEDLFFVLLAVAERYRPSVKKFPGISNEGRARSTYGMLRRFARCARGTSTTEFVLILPLILLFFFGTFTFATALYVHASMENAALEAVRRIAVGAATFNPTPVRCDEAPAQVLGTAENHACTSLPGWGSTFTIDARELCPELNVMVRITADASTAAVTDIFGFFGSRNLAAEIVMRNEMDCP